MKWRRGGDRRSSMPAIKCLTETAQRCLWRAEAGAPHLLSSGQANHTCSMRFVITPSAPSDVFSKYAWSTHEITPLGMSEGQVQAVTGLLPSHRLPAHPERTSAASEAAHSVAQASTCLLVGVGVHAAVRLCYLQRLIEPTLQRGTCRQWLGEHALLLV